MSVSTQKATKKQITKTNEYLAISSYIAEIAQDPDFSGILSPKKANKLQNLSIDLLNVLPCDESVKSILSCSMKFICKRPNVKDMNQIFAQNLAQTLGIEETGEQDIIDYVNELRAKNEANVSLKVEAVRLNQVIDELRSTIASLNTDLADCENRNKEMEEELKERPDAKQVDRLISKSNKKSNDLEKELNELRESHDSLATENQDLKQKIATLEAQSAENPEVEDLKRKLATKESEKQKLVAIFGEMTDQFNNQAEELCNDANMRNTLVTAVHKLTKMNQYLSEKLAFTTKKVDTMSRENAILQAQADKCELPHQFIEEMSGLKDSLLRVVPEDSVDVIEPILNKESDTYCERIVKMVTALNEFFANKEKESKEGKELDQSENSESLSNAMQACVSANLKYLNDLVESKDKAQWIMKPYSFDETRKIIIEQIARINNFLSKFNLVPSDVKSVLESLMLDVDQIDSYSNLSTLLDDFVEPATENEKLLFFYLIQAIAINDIIRKFAYEVRSQCDRQISDIRQLRNQVETDKEEFNNKLNDETKFVNNQMNVTLEENERLKQKLEEIRSKFADRASPVISRQILDIIDGKISAEEEEEEEDILEQSSSLIKIIEDKSEELSNAQEDLCLTQAENKELKDKLAQIEEEKNKNENENVAHIAHIEELLKSTQEKYDKQNEELNEQLNTLMKEKEELASQLIAAKNNEEAERKLEEKELAIKKLKKNNKALNRSLKEQLETTQDAIEHILKKSKHKQEKIKEKLAKVSNETANAIEEQEKTIKEKEEIIKASEAKINEFSKLTTDLQSELTQTKAKVSNTEIEKKVLESKLACLEEKFKRERSLIENQYRLKEMSIETECQLKMENQGAFLRGEMDQLINCIADNLCDDFQEEEETKLTKDSAIEVVQKVAEEMQTRKYVEAQLNEAQKEISATRKIFNTPKAESLITNATAVAKELEKAKDRTKQLETKIKGMKREVIEARALSQQQRSNQEWEEWARKINMLVSDGYCSVCTPNELRFSVEEMVFAAIGNKLTWSRLDSLRAQKKLLTSGMNLKKAKGQTLKSTLFVATFIRRLQKLSGNAQNKLAAPLCTDNKRIAQNSETVEKKPLFSQFLSNQ